MAWEDTTLSDKTDRAVHDIKEVLAKALDVTERGVANTIKDFPTAVERVVKPFESKKKTSMAIYDPKALLIASIVSGAIGIHSIFYVPTMLAGGVPFAAGLGACSYAAAAMNLKNAHNTSQTRTAYDLGTMTSAGLTSYSIYRVRMAPHVTAMGLGAVGLASLIANGTKSYEMRHGSLRR